MGGLNGTSSSIFTTRNQTYVFAASQTSHVLTVVDKSSTSAGSYPLSLPGVYRVSVNPGGSAALAFVQNSNYVYYPRKLTAAQTLAYCGWTQHLAQGRGGLRAAERAGLVPVSGAKPDNTDATGNYYGAPLVFDRPVKAVFSADGGTAYVLNCGPECGGTASSVSLLPVAPLIYLIGQQSGLLPCNASPCTNTHTLPITNIPIPGGASNALVDSSTLYVVGQKQMHRRLLGRLPDGGESAEQHGRALDGFSSQPGFHQRRRAGRHEPHAAGRRQYAVDRHDQVHQRRARQQQLALWLPDHGQHLHQHCDPAEPYIGDATGIAAVTGLHKIYTAEGGQVYIYSTVDGSAIDNQYVTVTGTAYDVAYMDAIATTTTRSTELQWSVRNMICMAPGFALKPGVI